MTDLTATTGSSIDNGRSLSERESLAMKSIHQDEHDLFLYHHRKFYPQRRNRTKLNYRDLQRGMYEEIRHSLWNSTSPPTSPSSKKNSNEQNSNEFVRHLWCLCQQPWDHLRLMLRCDSCANWYHSDCVGLKKEQAKKLKDEGDSFICPPCQGVVPVSRSKSKESPEQLKGNKRKRQKTHSSIQQQSTPLVNVPRRTIDSSNDLQSQPEMTNQCVVQSCLSSVQSGWVYCSPSCIRRHINDTLQTIQQSKGLDDDDIPTRDDIILYESQTKKILERDLTPNIEDLCHWLNQHPSYQIMQPLSSQTNVNTVLQSKAPVKSPAPTPRSPINETISKVLSVTTPPPSNPRIVPKKEIKSSNHSKIAEMSTTADIRSKVPTALYEKLLMRLEKSGETKLFSHQEIRTMVNEIEKEMFRIYEKTDTAYKNKFRSLLANISNMNNHFFYKNILSNQWTAKQIVAMKAEDMLPPEEKEKRKDEFNREVQMIIEAEAQAAQELMRRTKFKGIQRDLNEPVTLVPKPLVSEPTETVTDPIQIETVPINEPINDSNAKDNVPVVISAEPPKLSLPINSLKPSDPIPLNIPIPTLKPPPVASIHEQVKEKSTTIFSATDSDNDYIEPESPTGIDALIYDDTDNSPKNIDDNEKNSTGSTIILDSSPDDSIIILPHQPVTRDDYNPSKPSNDAQSTVSTTVPTSSLVTNFQWQGIITSSDTTLFCQSTEINGENRHLLKDIPDRLIIIGRLRQTDLWNFIQVSSTVRDIVFLTLVSSTSTSIDNEIFHQYLQVMRNSGRAAVIAKRMDTSGIRDMYILPADTFDCPASVLTALSLPRMSSSDQLFLVVIGSAKKTSKKLNRSSTNLSCQPAAVLQTASATRDPRLLKYKDGQSISQTTSSANETLNSSDSTHISCAYSAEDLAKLISQTFENLRQANSIDAMRPMIMSTMEILKENKRDDLSQKFLNDLRDVVTEWQKKKDADACRTLVTGDNLMEENMDVDNDDDQKEKEIKDQQNSLPIPSTRKRKSRFSDPIPNLCNVNEDEKSNHLHTDFSSHNNFPSAFSNKFRPILNVPPATTFSLPTSARFPSKPIRFSFAKEPLRCYKPPVSPRKTTLKPNVDPYENSPALFEEFLNRIRSTNQQSLSFQNRQWTTESLPLLPSRTETMVNLWLQQQRAKHRISSSTKEWRSNYPNYSTHYHDFDRPEEEQS